MDVNLDSDPDNTSGSDDNDFPIQRSVNIVENIDSDEDVMMMMMI